MLTRESPALTCRLGGEAATIGALGRGPEGAAGGAPKRPPSAWRLVRRRFEPPSPLFRARYDTVVHPRSGVQLERLVLEAPDWVNVVALTAARDVVLVRQYRFGAGRTTLEVPGGVVDEGEEPLDAARRELMEETGYAAERWRLLGTVSPNPAFLANRCLHFVAEDAELVAEPRPDPGEDIAVELVHISRLAERIASGEIDHALVISALSRVVDLRLPGARELPA
jgi:8-oxo-dGTP pyrophosphatase MutT (NUDIX family)